MLFERVRQNVRFKPVHSLAALFLADSSTIMVIHSVISGLGAEFSSEFAIAFGMARLVRRFRLPADLLTAGIISKAFPALNEIQIGSRALSAVFSSPQAQKEEKGKEEQKKPGIVSRLLKTVDSYGVSYIIAARMNGALTVLGLYQLLKSGIDANQFLSGFGISETTGDVLGTVKKKSINLYKFKS
jgi:hypothetical protein